MTVLVKICGLKSREDAQCAVENGASMLGMILVPGRSRTVPLEEAKRISDYVHTLPSKPIEHKANASNIEKLTEMTSSRPLLVGVFRNQSLEDILETHKQLHLDLIQLHGNEPLEYTSQLPVPVIRRYTPRNESPEEFCKKIMDPQSHLVALIDSEEGGQGVKVNWEPLEAVAACGGRYILAGGLNPSNVASAVAHPGVVGVDVSGGVETEGRKDHGKVKEFIANARQSIKS